MRDKAGKGANPQLKKRSTSESEECSDKVKTETEGVVPRFA